MARRKTSKRQAKTRETLTTFIFLGAVLLLLAGVAIHVSLPAVLANVR